MPVPNTFANATATIPLSQLDANFATTITLGNTAIQLGNTVSTLNDMTLANVTVTSGNVTITNVTVTTANVTTANIATAEIANVTVSGTGTFAAGSNTAPSITTSGDTNTGIFFPAADTVAIGTGGTERLRVDSSGNVGIATTSPDGGLDVEKQNSYFGDTTNGGRLYFRRGVDGSAVGRVGWISGSNVNFEIANDSGSGNILFQTNSAERMRLDASGNLLVGTTTASANFYVYNNPVSYAGLNASAILSSSASQSTGTGGLLAFEGKYTSGGALANFAAIGGLKENSTDNNYAGYLAFYTRANGSLPAERARITSGGYFKASNFGTYASATGSYHEFLSDVDDTNVRRHSTNASFSSRVDLLNVTRSATSAYSFLLGYSGNLGDLEFNLRGDGNGYADGTWNNNGADYAEFFESATGAALTLGATVVLDGNKVREATDQDPASAIMGVVRPKEPSKASMVVGNTAWNKWANKYLTDDFDRYIMEDHNVLEWTDEEGKLQTYESHSIPAEVTVPDYAVVKTHDDKGNKFQHYKLNPAWNPDAEYVNRENRPEWIIVGLVGQVKVLKGQPVNDRWIKMRDVSATVEEWMIR